MCTAAWLPSTSTGMPRVMRHADHVLHRHQRAGDVRHVRDGDELGARRQQPLELLEQELARIRDRHPLQDGAIALAAEVPGNDVGMVLQDGEHDLVAGADVIGAVGVGDEVDGGGGVAREDDLIGAAALRKRRVSSRASSYLEVAALER